MNAKDALLRLSKGEDILAICIGEKGWDFEEKPPAYYGKGRINEALKLLDFEFDGGFGGEEGYSLYAWTKSFVIVKGAYDGSEWYEALPRNPTRNERPESIGGG